MSKLDSREILDCTHITHIEKLEEAKNVGKKNVLGTYSCSYMVFEEGNGNGRKYPREIATKKILNKTIKDKLAKGQALLGEIDHPKDRFITDMDYVAIATTNLWYEEEKDELWGTFDVLDTPRGRIVHTLLEYGYPVGISARAMGKGVTKKGVKVIDVDSYMFKTFDCVVDPGFDSSRVDTTNESLKESLTSLYESYNDEEKENVKDLLETLDITDSIIYTNETNKVCEAHHVSVSNTVESDLLYETYCNTENDNKALKELLQEKLVEIDKLNTALNECKGIILSKVNYIDSLDEIIDDLKLDYSDLSTKYETLKNDNKATIYNLEKQNESLKHQVGALANKITTLNETIASNNDYISELETLMKDNNAKREMLVESLNEAHNELNELKTYEPVKKDIGIKILSVINESQQETKKVVIDETTSRLLKNLNKKEGN